MNEEEKVTCPICSGSGSRFMGVQRKRKSPCGQCNGTGKVPPFMKETKVFTKK